jgi:hypothetical protein
VTFGPTLAICPQGSEKNFGNCTVESWLFLRVFLRALRTEAETAA